MPLPKLVRDLVPQRIEESGRQPICSTVEDVNEHLMMLQDKMAEEVEEFMDDPSLEEAGDCYEVLRTLVELHGLSMHDVVKEADRKVAECGGFTGGIILEDVEEDL